MVEIKNSEDLENWLNARPEETRRADAALIASRAALRVSPLVVFAFNANTEDLKKSAIIIPLFRALVAASVMSARPKQMQSCQAIDAAKHVYKAFLEAVAANSTSADHASIAARSSYAYAVRAAEFALNSDALATTRAAANAVRAADFRSDEFWFAVKCDADRLEQRNDHTQIANEPLWPDGRVPIWSEVRWALLSKILLSLGEDWTVWTDWYQDRLNGNWQRPNSEALELAICQISDELWEAGPAEVNNEISALVAKHRSEPGFLAPSFSGASFTNAQPNTQPSIGTSRVMTADEIFEEITGSSLDEAGIEPSNTVSRKRDTRHKPEKLRKNEPPTIAFFSYTRNDDRIMRGLLSKIRQELEDTLTLYHGEKLQVFQDTSDIEGGAIWRDRLEQALTEATIFVPMITPAFFKSKHCREELSRFLTRDDASTFVLPVHLINTDFTKDTIRDDLIANVEARQWIDWRKHSRRYEITDDLIHDVHDAANLILKRWRSIN